MWMWIKGATSHLTLSIILSTLVLSVSLENNISDTHSDCSTSAVGASNQAALCRCQGNLELLPIQMQRPGHAYWHRNVANHILTAGAHNLGKQKRQNGKHRARAYVRAFMCVYHIAPLESYAH